MSEQVYHFGFGVDARYVKYAGVLMTNLVHQHLGQPLCFHLACDGIGEEDKRRLDAFTMLYRNVELYIYDMTKMLDRLNQIRSACIVRYCCGYCCRRMCRRMLSGWSIWTQT